MKFRNKSKAKIGVIVKETLTMVTSRGNNLLKKKLKNIRKG